MKISFYSSAFVSFFNNLIICNYCSKFFKLLLLLTKFLFQLFFKNLLRH